MSDIADSWNDRYKWNNCYRVAKMSSDAYALAKKLFRKFQQISANFSNCNGVYLQKRIISTTGECALKKNSTTIASLYYDLNQFKTLKISISFSILWSGEISPLINDFIDMQIYAHA